jgi:ADP-ribose pyrophosphatase YjhB (NUDIX family)
MEPRWIKWARALQAISQTGLHFAENKYDLERYSQIQEIAAEVFSDYGKINKEVVKNLFAKESGYATPKVDVRGVVFRNSKILLVREIADDNLWTLPGGWADVNESPSEAVVREVLEESGYETRTVKLLAVYDRAKHDHVPPYPYHIYKLFFLCEIIRGKAKPSGETSEIAFFSEHDIPELSISRVTPKQIARFFAHKKHPEWPTDFD